MSFSDLFFLAVGGVIGAGWSMSAVGADQATGSLAVFSWIIGGALVLVIAAVMVELSTVVPKTGGLTFLPLQSSGPLLATIVAAGVWIFYAVSPASAAVAMVNELAGWRLPATLVNAGRLTSGGMGWAALFLLGITAVTMLGPRLFLIINNALTAFKILVPLLIVGLLFYARLHPPHGLGASHPGGTATTRFGVGTMLGAVTGANVIFAYLGFQGPLDFAGNVRRRGVGEALRLRWAVYGTVCGSIFLYVSLQFVVIYMQHHPHAGWTISSARSPYPDFAKVVAPAWAGPSISSLISLDTVLSPAGTGMVFTYVLTREVAALSRAHLTHRGLQRSKYSVIPLATGRLSKLFGDDRLDVYWLIIIVDLLVSAVALLCSRGDWSVLGVISTILALIVYSTQSVVLAALRRWRPGRFPRVWYSILAQLGFVSIAVIFVLAGWNELWKSMAVLTAGCLLLFGLPLVLQSSRWYDAAAHAVRFRQWRTNPAARSAVLFFSLFALLALASLVVKQHAWPVHPAKVWDAAGLTVIALLAWATFHRLVGLSVAHMREHPPTLPEAMPMARHAAPTPPRGSATGKSG